MSLNAQCYRFCVCVFVKSFFSIVFINLYHRNEEGYIICTFVHHLRLTEVVAEILGQNLMSLPNMIKGLPWYTFHYVMQFHISVLLNQTDINITQKAQWYISKSCINTRHAIWQFKLNLGVIRPIWWNICVFDWNQLLESFHKHHAVFVWRYKAQESLPDNWCRIQYNMTQQCSRTIYIMRFHGKALS